MNAQKREDAMAMTDEMITQCEVFMENLVKKGKQTDPLYLSIKETRQHLQIGKLELEDIYKRNERHRKGNVPAPE